MVPWIHTNHFDLDLTWYLTGFDMSTVKWFLVVIAYILRKKFFFGPVCKNLIEMNKDGYAKDMGKM